MHVPNLVWIVVEDSDHRSELVKNLLERCEIQTVHLNAVTPDYYKKDPSRPRGVLQRNKGLSWIREHYSAKNCNGVVYFGDDDNKYDLRLFEQEISD
jgi:galactosylgalactosylxylosylprotein 3-beta-glucuronosyltransferase 3